MARRNRTPAPESFSTPAEAVTANEDAALAPVQSESAKEKQKLLTRLYRAGNATYVRIDATAEGFSATKPNTDPVEDMPLHGRFDVDGYFVLMCGENVLPAVRDFKVTETGFAGDWKIGEQRVQIVVPWAAVRQIHNQSWKD